MAENEGDEPPPRFEVHLCGDGHAVWDCDYRRWVSKPESRNAAYLLMNDLESEHRAALRQAANN